MLNRFKQNLLKVKPKNMRISEIKADNKRIRLKYDFKYKIILNFFISFHLSTNYIDLSLNLV